jgi:hypothetical protein
MAKMRCFNDIQEGKSDILKGLIVRYPLGPLLQIASTGGGSNIFIS